jgi:hypothetical protein
MRGPADAAAHHVPRLRCATSVRSDLGRDLFADDDVVGGRGEVLARAGTVGVPQIAIAPRVSVCLPNSCSTVDA